MDYGSAVSQKGYDVKTCADRFLVYSSSFQTLKIAGSYAVSCVKPASGETTITITHNLGFIAPFIVMYNGSSGSRGVGTSYFFFDATVAWTATTLEALNYANELTIEVGSYFDSDGAAAGDTVYFTVYILLDAFETIAENTINSGTASGSSSADYGIKVSKAGYDVKSCNNDQLVFSSSFPNNIVHKKGITDVGDSEISHNLGYVPNFLVYEYDSDYSADACRFRLARANTTKIYGLATGQKHAYIIFKNPIE